jgi:hypothetical protein
MSDSKISPQLLAPLPSSASQQVLPKGFSQPKRRGPGRPKKSESYQALRGPRPSSIGANATSSSKSLAPPILTPHHALCELESTDHRQLQASAALALAEIGLADTALTSLIRLNRGSSYLDHVVSNPHHSSTVGNAAPQPAKTSGLPSDLVWFYPQASSGL